MTIRISPRKLNVDIERKILSNLITNKSFTQQIILSLENETFETPYCRRIAKWVVDFFNEYQDAPQKTIQAIFNVQKNKNMSPEDAELISDFLLSLSGEYVEDVEDSKVNTSYLVKTSLEYIRKRHYEILAEKLAANAKLGNISECEKVLLNDKGVSGSKASYVNLHDEITIKNIVEAKSKSELFKIDGVLGELVGPISRGMLIGCQGRTGLGKSWVIREFLFQAILNKLNCFEFNFEMGIENVAYRHYKRMLGVGDSDGEYHIPVFDCSSNAMGLCHKKERKSKVSLINGVGEIPSFGQHDPLYVACDVCRGKNKDYKVSTWYESTYRRAISSESIEKGVKGLKLMYGDKLRTICLPSGTATVSDCFHQIDMAEYLEGFVSDFASFDYDEIMSSEIKYLSPLDSIDEIYKTLRGQLQKRGMAGIIGMQVNRQGAQKRKSSTFDTSGSFKKIMHLDLVICLDQSEAEKEAGILNISVGKMREGGFQLSRSVKVLVNLALGQSYLDAEWGEIEYHDHK